MTIESLDQARERLRPYAEKAQTFTGWMDLPQTTPLGPTLSWNYMARAQELMDTAKSVVDMGTGGGERFSELLTGFSGRAIATEEWVVNAPIAASHLRRFGCETIRAQSVHLPLADESFDLVLNRHEDLDPRDVARVLMPGGRVLTQQAWNLWKELNAYFPRRIYLADLLEDYRNGFVAAGLDLIDARSAEWPSAYEGLGDLVYILCIAPWEIPGFDPLGSDLEALLELERDLLTPDGLVLNEGYFIIEAAKPA